MRPDQLLTPDGVEIPEQAPGVIGAKPGTQEWEILKLNTD
jgi:hypothetical protein